MSKIKPDAKVPIIGGDSMPPEQAQAVVDGLMMRLNPMIEELVQSLANIDTRLQVVEGIQKVFPEKVDVTIKHEYPKNPVFESVKIMSKEPKEKE